MQLVDVDGLRPLKANLEPAKLGINVPKDLSTLKRGSICIIIRRIGNEQAVLLIKRAVRPTDRWSGHIAFPGGKQDPGETDLETAIRETREEVGLDLNKVATLIGPLDPRLIRISWGRQIALVLCPFVFSIKKGFEDVPIIPQESEVAAAFWYPLSKLFDENNKALHPIAAGDRINLPGSFGKVIKYQAGEMLFDAINIWPTIETPLLPAYPWRMWGITLAILQDFRNLIDPEFNPDSIRLPTFKAPDLRLLLTIMSGPFTSRKRKVLRDAPHIGDLTNHLLENHFTYFPWVIGTGIALRVTTIATFLWWLYSHPKGRL